MRKRKITVCFWDKPAEVYYLSGQFIPVPAVEQIGDFLQIHHDGASTAIAAAEVSRFEVTWCNDE